MRSLEPPGETKKLAIGSTLSTVKPASSVISRRIASSGVSPSSIIPATTVSSQPPAFSRVGYMNCWMR